MSLTEREQLVRVGRTTVWEQVGLPEQRVGEGEEMYGELARRPIELTRSGDGRRVYARFPPLAGEEIAGLRHFAAPSKSFYYQFDMRDTRGDWQALFEGWGRGVEERLEAHRRIPGWKTFEAHWQDLLRFMQEGMERYEVGKAPEEGAEVVVPVAGFERGEERWKWMEMDRPEVQAEMRQILDEGSHPEWAWLASLFVAGFSPEVTRTWGPRRGYRGGASQFADRGNQDMGPTQAIPLAEGLKGDLLERSNLCRALLKMATEETGK